MITPTRGYVLIEPEKAEDKTSSGLYLPENAQEKPQKGTVVATGGATFEMLQYEQDSGNTLLEDFTGKKVYYRRWGGDDIKDDGKELKIVKFEDVIAIIS